MCCSFKHSSFLVSSDLKPMKIDLMHGMPQQCMFALSMCILRFLLEQGVMHSTTFKSCKTYLGPIVLPGDRIWQLIYPD
jgi:hypothetical protein